MNSEKPLIVFKPFEKQMMFIEAFFNDVYRYLLYGGAIRGGKSYLGAALLVLLCKMYPMSRHVIVRRDYPSLKRNVIPVCNKVIPTKFLYKFNKSDFIYKMKNGSEILLIAESFEDDPDLNRFKGLEFNSALLEEMNELREVTYWKIHERCGSWIPPAGATRSISKIIGTCNPDQGYVKQLFYTPWKHGKLKAPYFYLPAKITDNPYIHQDYIDGLKDLPEEIYKVFVEGSWEAADAIHQLVSWVYISRSERIIEECVDKSTYMGVDVGREGSDPSVMTIIKGNNIVYIGQKKESKTVEVRDWVLEKQKEFSVNSDDITIDSVGVGGGVVDELWEREIFVVPMKGGATHITTSRGIEFTIKDFQEAANSNLDFKNWKALNYWYAANMLKNDEIGNFTHETLQSDASAIWYFTPDDKTIQVEKKDDLKKRIGRSPDYWESYCYAAWGKTYKKYFGSDILTVSGTKTQEAKAA